LKRVAEIPAAAVVVGVLSICMAVFLLLFAYFVATGSAQMQARLEDRSQAAARVVATNAGWIATVANQTLRRVDAALGPSMTGDAQSLKPAVEGLPADVDIYIIDADANTIFSTIEGASRVNVADREYFTAVRDGADFYTSPMLLSRLTGENIFVFSKRVMRNGAFAGAIMISFDDTMMQDFWSSLDMSAGSTVALFRIDGALMARYPPLDRPVSLADHPLINEHFATNPNGTYTSESSPIDGVARVVSYRVVPGTSILAVASIASDPSWKEFHRAIVAVFMLVAPMILVLVVGAIWVLRLLDRDAKRRDELQQALETNVLLFREIHHRVKNNLQSVQSLVRMQDMPRNAKIDLQSRLSAMAAMHEHIYRHDRYVDIDAHDLVPAVVDEVVRAYGAEVEMVYDIDHAMIDRDHMTPLSLLLSELVTNALKYAFVDGRSGQIIITLRDLGNGRCSLAVQDNGVGLGDVPDNTTSMGLRLIKGVVSQMSGKHSYVETEGTRFEAELALTTEGHHAAEPAVQ
jgi:two-component sensor histidine kinase